MKSVKFLSGNAIKIIAAIAMVIDHIGLMFFPRIKLLRIIGRLAFPLFAFMIAEGCKYTKNKLKYFLSVFVLAVLCQTVSYIFTKDTYLSVLVTFSLSIILIFALQNFQYVLKNSKSKLKKILFGLIFILMLISVCLLNQVVKIDYGFFGCVLPVFVALVNKNEKLHYIFSIFAFAIGLVLLSVSSGGIQWFSLFSLVILLFYSGERGKLKMKYFFYIFYPVHLAILYGISLLI